MITINGEPLSITNFPDGTSQVWKLDPAFLTPGRSASVRWKFTHEGEVMHLAQLASLLALQAVPAFLDIEFLPYARQDKPVSNDATFALRPFAALLNAMGWARVTIYDPHSSVATNLIQNSLAKYYVDEATAAFTVSGSDVLCFPDAGAREKYAAMFGALPIAFAEKVRDQATGFLVTGALSGEPVHGKRVLIVDDICDGGATFIGLAAKLRYAGAASVALFVSHGLFTRGVKALTDAGIARVFTPQGEVFP